jgi:hypothetical protein
MRGVTTGSDWLVEVRAGAGGEAVVSWVSAAVPATGLWLWQVTLPGGSEVPGSRVAMGTATDLRVPAGETRHFAVRSALVEFELSLRRGWNLISLPIEPVPAAASAVFSDTAVPGGRDGVERFEDGLRGVIYAGSIWGWDQTLSGGQGAYAAATDLAALRGYWIYVDRERRVRVVGTPPASTQLTLVRRWNLLGPARDVLLPQVAGVLNTVWWWDGAWYQLAPLLEMGYGYWIYCTAAGTPVDLGR